MNTNELLFHFKKLKESPIKEESLSEVKEQLSDLLVGKIVKNETNMPNNELNDYGFLVRIDKGRYPFILAFASGSTYGVSEISDNQPQEDSVCEIALRNIIID